MITMSDDVYTMLKIVCHNVSNIFRDTNVKAYSRYHVDYDKRKDRVNDMSIDITLSFTVSEENLADIENVLSNIRLELEQLNGNKSR